MSDPAMRAALEDQVADARGRMRVLGHADEDHRAVALQQRRVGVEVVRRGHRVEDQVEADRVLQHRVGILRDDALVGAEALRVVRLAGRGGEQDRVRAEGVR